MASWFAPLIPTNYASPVFLTNRGILGMNRRNVEFIGRYNSRDRFPLVDDKLKTKNIAVKAGLMVPDMLHVVTTQTAIEAIAQILKAHECFVIKPAQGSGGKGILVIVRRNDDRFVKPNGSTVELVDIKRHLSNILSGLHSLGGRSDVAIVEALVVANPLFDDFSYEGVPDIRLIVFKGYPVMGMLRLATKVSDGKANLHQGAVGVGLDIGTGKAIAGVQHNQLIKHHPDTDALLTDLAVPNWRPLLRLAARCYEVTQLGYLGCDIVIDDTRGPLLLELNARPGLSIQIANDQGLLPRLRHIENKDEFHTPVDERVDYAMEHFTVFADGEQSSLFPEQPDDPIDTETIEQPDLVLPDSEHSTDLQEASHDRS